MSNSLSPDSESDLDRLRSNPPGSQDDLSQNLTPTFWETRYREGTARWDLGEAAPPFESLLNSVEAPQPGRMLVLGMGRGHDALLFASHGFEVVGVDFAPSAVAAATVAAQARGLTAQFLQRDIFELADEFTDGFDYVLEHTCFCAIAPSQRPAYAQLVQALLRPGGELIALFWAHGRPGGPPFGCDLEEIHDLFNPGFKVRSIDRPLNSVASRQHEEYLARFPVNK